MFVLLLLPITAVNPQQTSNEFTPITIGQTVTLDPTILNKMVDLPKSYPRADKPSSLLLYALDGELYFSQITGIVSWLSGFLDQIPEHIIVGIKNTDRNRD